MYIHLYIYSSINTKARVESSILNQQRANTTYSTAISDYPRVRYNTIRPRSNRGPLSFRNIKGISSEFQLRFVTLYQKLLTAGKKLNSITMAYLVPKVTNHYIIFTSTNSKISGRISKLNLKK